MAGVAITVTEVVALEVELAREIDGKLLQQMTLRLFSNRCRWTSPTKARIPTINYRVYLDTHCTNVNLYVP